MSTSSDKNQLSNEWPDPKKFRKSIRTEFSIYFSLIIIALMLVTGIVITGQYVDITTQSVIEKVLVQARSYSGPAGKHIISTDNPDVLLLNNICKKLIADNPDIYWVGITGNDDVYLAHSDIKQVISSKKMDQIFSDSYQDILNEGEAFDIANDTIYLNVPISENNILLGRLGLASSTREIIKARQLSIISVVTITVVMLMIGLPFTMFILQRKLKPVKIITNHLKDINFEDISLEIPITSKNEFGYLAQTLHTMGIKLNTAQKDIIIKERVSREMEIAREIQYNILPKDYPQSNKFEFHGMYQSAMEVGGDYYDFIKCDEKHIAFLVADVSGKSLPGMLIMLLTRDIVKKYAFTSHKPDELLSLINSELLLSIKKGMFVTMFIGVLNIETGLFEFASAGHNPLVYINSGSNKIDLIKTKGYPLGMMPADQFDKRIELGSLSLNQGDQIIQYTDGINEAHNSEREEFGMDRLVDSIRENIKFKQKEFVSKVMEKHQLFVGNADQYDDMTMVALKWQDKTVENIDYNVEAEVNAN